MSRDISDYTTEVAETIRGAQTHAAPMAFADLSSVLKEFFFASTGRALRWYGEDEEDKETAVVNAPLQPDRRRVPVRTGGADDHRGWGH